MCLTYPGLVVSVDGGDAVVRGEHRDYRASAILVPDVAPGDYVVVAAGTILERLAPEEAAEIRALLAADLAPSPAPDISEGSDAVVA
ncbi:MAG TPA: HypC/HybG/HupF family hydrogenase formation chaperone [Candidatus Limnocylindrales bacterium]|jgi:hydrogenase maturation factor